MSDLAALMKHAPTVAAGFMGTNQANQQQLDQLRQLQLAQLLQTGMEEEKRKQALHPLELEKSRLANSQTSAQIPGLEAASRLKGYEADIRKQTMGGEVSSTNAENKAKVVKGAMVELGPWIDVIEKKQPIERHAELDRYFGTMDMDEGLRKEIGMKFSKIPAEQLPAALRKMHETILRNTPQYAQAVDQTKMNRDSAERVARIYADGRVNAAAQRGGSSKGDPNSGDVNEIMLWIRNEIKGKPDATQLAIINRWIDSPKTPEEVRQVLIAEAASLRESVKRNPRNTPPPGSVDRSAYGVQTVPPVDPYAAGQKSAPAASGQRIQVTHPDGRTGTIPAEQLDRALKEGFKKVQ